LNNLTEPEFDVREDANAWKAALALEVSYGLVALDCEVVRDPDDREFRALQSIQVLLPIGAGAAGQHREAVAQDR
jgi:hypothetical protein